MSFFKQLKLLLRQKILLRKRQPTTLFLELFWPAIVFLAVLTVRLQFPAVNRQTCYYNSKALPSAGSVNFWQSFVCNVDNPCLNSSSYNEIPYYPNARIHKLVDQLSPLIIEKNVTSVIRDLPKGIQLIGTIVDMLSQSPLKSTIETGFPFMDILMDSGTEKIRPLRNKTSRSSKSMDTLELLALTKAHLHNSEMRSALNSLKEAIKAMPYIKGFVANVSQSLNLDEELDKIDLKGDPIELLGSPHASTILGKLMCGQTLPALSKEMQLMKVVVKKPNINEADAASLASKFCQHGYRQIMQMQGGPVIWAFLKPILAGKVLYTPKNDLTDSIMARMNKTFAFMSEFADVLHAWAQTISSLKDFYKDPNANQRLRSLKHFIVQFLGREFEGIFDDTETFNLIEKMAKSGAILGLVQMAANVAQCVHLNRFVGLSNELELENMARKLTKSHEFIAGIVFNNMDTHPLTAHPLKLSHNIEYKIRIDIDFVPSTKALKSRIWEPGPRDNYITDLGYLKGFVEIQEMVDRAITSVLINDTKLLIEPAVHLQQFPYLCYDIDKFGNYIRALSPLITTIAWIFLIAYLIREQVLERELHLEEVLRVMGLKPGVAWMTWFLLGLIVMAFGTLCGLTLLKLGGLIPNSDPVLLYIFFMSFSLSLIMYCYMMSSFFKTATIAALSGIVGYLASFLPFMVAITLENEMSYIHKVLTCFSMSASFCYGMMYMSRFEVQGVGMQWTNLWHSPMQADTMNVGTAMIMMFVDSILYFVIAWYISHVCPPGNNAHRYPWYFFLTYNYWCCNIHNTSKSKSKTTIQSADQQRNGKIGNTNGYGNNPGIQLQGLYVIFNKSSKKCKHVAVSNLSLSLKEGQITTMLGRNGAGKTTTINVLTGQLPPTAGSVYIYGHPVPDEFMQARKLLGYCPQYNTLFMNMTVREHLQFYSDLKGLLNEDEIEEDINNMLHSTGLWHLQHHLVRHLSGGLQRRLCVALAFVGGSKLIILDEPTASVDPVARRSIWDLIVQQKQSRTVLLTTHHMDEAEILSDEVAVIHRGKLLCIGSPLLLKSKYGCGYQLTVSRQGNDDGDNDSGRSSNGPTEESSDVERLMAFTKCLIPNATFVEDYGQEVILTLPQHGSYGVAHDYATFFKCLDANIHALGFGNYGLTSTTLEEVFLTLCNLEESHMPMEAAKLAVARKFSQPLNNEENSHDMRMNLDPTMDWNCPELVTGVQLKFKQLCALLNKRFTHTLRDWKTLFCTLFLPCIFIAFAMGMTLIKPSFAPDPALPLMPTIYGQSSVSFYSAINSSQNSKLIANELIKTKPKIPDCLKPRENWRVSKCPVLTELPSETNYLPKHLKTLSGDAWTTNAKLCRCNECNTDMTSMTPLISSPALTGHGFVYDLSRVNVSQFLLRTYSEFMDRRWGGWSFHNNDNNMTTKSQQIVKIWFDNNGYHSLPSYLSAVNNAIMRANLKVAGIDNSSQYRITTYSHPLHIRSSQLGDQSLMQRAGDAGIALIILVGFIFIPTSFVFYIVRERTFEEKQLQRIFGVGTVLYWLSSLLWDLISLSVAIGFSAIIISCFQLPIYVAHLNLPAVLTLLFLFGWAMTTLVYLMEKLFNEASIAFMVIYCLALFIGINTMIMRLLIDVFKLIEVSPVFQSTFDRIAIIFPPYALLSGLVDIHRNQLFADIFKLFDQDTYVNPFSMQMLGPYYITLAVEGIILFIVNLILEYFNFSSYKTKQIIKSIVNNEDNDVAEERKKVHLNETNSDILKIVGLTKVFQSMFGKRIAVDNVSFSVPRGECFGLLGVNGAGKTTLFRILTGQLKPTTGQAIINSKDIRKILSSNYQSLGYCPQADALDFVLTPYEHLTIYSHLRGIPTQHIPTIVNESLAKFQLMPHSQMPVLALSRGNRRKLCLAIAMLGNPQLALLDEPTSGLDPQSRRYIIQNIQNAVRDRRSVLLTSHSMEECDILCSRLAIMVNGRFKCIGSPQYLKHKFGSGYLITLRLHESENNHSDAITFMNQYFPSCVLRAHHHTMLEFSLPYNHIPLSTIFDNLQKGQQKLNLQDFSVSQTSLDQVFVSFANQQINDYQSPIPSKQNTVYSNPAFISSSENLNANKKQAMDYTVRSRGRFPEDNHYMRANKKVNHWKTCENTTQF
ncbi:phospholipid-transporting ATPase ABCA1-like [Oppia nitens]|uniref:phospholipid-transporting ATPase ABCA1-like n=1 Tax=Oppia nitens TaxID=1686743 RepID=UPI0023DA2238|nr:phospholipid-transporting ATPase ABCA1-like [Oppia nitens]